METQITDLPKAAADVCGAATADVERLNMQRQQLALDALIDAAAAERLNEVESPLA